MTGTLDSISMPVLVIILVVGLIVGFGGWGRGWRPPGQALVKHHANPRFWRCHQGLPKKVRELAG